MFNLKIVSTFFKSIITLQRDLEEINSLLGKHLSIVSTINAPNIIQLLLNEDLTFHAICECHIFDLCFFDLSLLHNCRNALSRTIYLI